MNDEQKKVLLLFIVHRSSFIVHRSSGPRSPTTGRQGSQEGSLVVADVDPLLDEATGGGGGQRRQEREQPLPRLSVQRRPVLRHLERLDVLDAVALLLAVGTDEAVAEALGQRTDALAVAVAQPRL